MKMTWQEIRVRAIVHAIVMFVLFYLALYTNIFQSSIVFYVLCGVGGFGSGIVGSLIAKAQANKTCSGRG